MNDKIKYTPVVGLLSAAYGVGTATDNHGNSIRGRDLTCSTGENVRLSLSEWSQTFRSIEMPHAQADTTPDGSVDLGNMRSPLQVRCEREHNQSSAPRNPRR